MISATNPYVGPRAFQTGERLYGRDREARELVDLLIAERIVLMYSPSGAGKTSLIQASVIPAMKDEDFHVLPLVRPGLIESTRHGAPPGNPFVARVIRGCEEGRPADDEPLTDTAGIALAGYFSQRAWIQGKPGLRLLVLDQFEEVLNSDEAEESKLEFFVQLGDALKDGQTWALFAMREESIAALDGYRHLLPTRLSTRFRLDLLTHPKATEAIREPAETAGVTFVDDAVECLLKDLSTARERTSDGSEVTRQVAFVEPLYLQVVCQRLWDQLPAGTAQIRLEDIHRAEKGAGENGSASPVEQALKHYYDSAIISAAKETQTPSRAIREWLERELITPQGLRRQVPLGEKETAGLPNHTVAALAKHSLVRCDFRSGATWYEVTHDRIAGVILSSNAGWYSDNLEPFQVRAAQWNRFRLAGAEKAANAEVLQGEELNRALKWEEQNSPDALTDTDRHYLRHCEEVWNRGKSERKVKASIRWVLIPALLMTGWSLALMYNQRANIEEQSKNEAKEYSLQLEKQQIKERAGALLSAAATNKWRANNHELASLLALHAHRLNERHGEAPDLGAWGQEMLRASLQSQPFAFSESLGGDKTANGEIEPALSTSLTIATIDPDARGFQVTSITHPTKEVPKVKAEAELFHVDFSPTGRYLVAITERGATLHEASNNYRIQVSIVTEGRPTGIFCMSPDERMLTIATQLGKVEVWRLSADFGSAERIRTLGREQLGIGEFSTVSALACSRQLSWLIWGSETGDIGYVDLLRPEVGPLWMATNKFRDWPDSLKADLGFRADALDYGVAAIHHLPNRRWLLVFYRQGPPKILDLAMAMVTGRPPSAYLLPNDDSQAFLRVEQEQGSAVRRVAHPARVLLADVSHDENMAIVGGARSLIGEWKLGTLSIRPRPEEGNPQLPLKRIPHESTAVYAAYREYRGLQSTVTAIRYIPEKTGTEFARSRQTRPLVAAIDAGLEMRVWSNGGLTNAAHHVFKPRDPGVVNSLAFLDEEGRYLAYGGSRTSGVLSVQQATHAVAEDKSISLPDGIRALAVNQTFDHVAIATKCNENAMGCTQTSSWVMDLKPDIAHSVRRLPKDLHTDGQWAAATDPGGKTLVTAGWDRRAVVWKSREQGDGAVAWGDPVLLRGAADAGPGHNSPVLSVAIHPTRGEVATGTKDGAVHLWHEDASGAWSDTVLVEIGIPVYSLAYSPDGKRLVAGDDNGFLRIWNIPKDGTYQPRAPISAHQGAVFAIEFAGDDVFATGGSDGMVYVWNGDPAKRSRLRLEGPKGEVMSIAIPAAGNLLAAGDATGAVHFWELGLDAVMGRACTQMRRNLSWSEWERYLGTNEYECTCPLLPPGSGVPPEKLSKDHYCQLADTDVK